MVGMFFAFGSAGFAEVGTELANIGRVGTTTGHERHGHVANLGTIAIKPDAVNHVGNVLLAQARLGAGITGDSAGLAGGKAGLIGLGDWGICHNQVEFCFT